MRTPPINESAELTQGTLELINYSKILVDRHPPTGDTVLVKTREMTGRIQTL
jgi:hypothetical protein